MGLLLLGVNMNILQMPAYFLPSKGGIEYCVYYMSKEFVRYGNKVMIVSSGRDSGILEGIKVKKVSSFNILKSPFSFSLLFKLLKLKPDIIHLHYPYPLWIEIGSLFARIRNIPYVVHCHGNEIRLKGIKSIFSFIYNNLFFDSILKHSSAIITNTKKVIPQSRLLTKYKDKIYVIPHGIDLDKFNIKNKIENKGKSKIILYAGALREYKGLEYLIRALSLTKKKIKARLIIIGQGDQEKYLKKLVNNLKLDGFVEFKGFVSEKELIKYYGLADLFILPSPTIEESFGLVALEALAMNIPTIVTSGAGVSEIFEKEKIDGIVAPKNPEAIAEKAIEILSKNTRKDYRNILKKYNWKDMSKKYLDVYESCTK